MRFLILFSLFFISSCVTHSLPQVQKIRSGIFISGAGLSGSGKTSTIKALSDLAGGKAFLEPTESEWPLEFQEKKRFGAFSSMMAFRSLRIDLATQAEIYAESDGLGFLDSYYEKFQAGYMGEPGSEWLMHKNDLYFETAKQIALLDSKHLPDPDLFILFIVDYETWKRFLEKRGRKLDKNPEFLKGFELQKYIERELLKLAKQRSIPVIQVKQSFSSPELVAREILDIIKEKYPILHKKIIKNSL